MGEQIRNSETSMQDHMSPNDFLTNSVLMAYSVHMCVSPKWQIIVLGTDHESLMNIWNL